MWWAISRHRGPDANPFPEPPEPGGRGEHGDRIGDPHACERGDPVAFEVPEQSGDHEHDPREREREHERDQQAGGRGEERNVNVNVTIATGSAVTL